MNETEISEYVREFSLRDAAAAMDAAAASREFTSTLESRGVSGERITAAWGEMLELLASRLRAAQ